MSPLFSALVLYVQPYESLDLRSVAAAFHVDDLSVLESELSGLILDGSINVGPRADYDVRR